MSDYAFYARMLRFVAGKTGGQEDERMRAMAAALAAVADEVEARGAYTVPADRLDLTARALAGVAGFLQQRILPEAVAHGNAAGERQVRWVVDASMEAVSLLLSRAALGGEGPVGVMPPPPPEG